MLGPNCSTVLLARVLRHCSATAAVVVCLLGAARAADDGTSSHGLAWNRSGLPATIPLQVRTPAGRHYFLRLAEVESDQDVLAAHIVGGRFFKVLVPPGTFSVRFDFGDEWQGPDVLFGNGDDAGSFVLPDALTFAVQGAHRKEGHLIDLGDFLSGEAPSVSIKQQTICQISRLEVDPRYPDLAPYQGGERRERAPLSPSDFWVEYPRFTTRSLYCD